MSEHNPFGSRFLDEYGNLSAPWMLFFQELHSKLDETNLLTVVRVPEASGAGNVLYQLKKSRGTAMWLFYYAQRDTNVRAGIITVGWASDGTLPTIHGQRDIQDIGDTSDLSFDFNYNSTTEKIQWRSTSTETYRIFAIRIMI